MKVLLLLDNEVYNDKRAINELQLFQEMQLNVTIVHRVEAGKPQEDSFMGYPMKRLYHPDLHKIKFRKERRALIDEIAALDFNVLLCHNHLMYFIAREVKKRKPHIILIYESRELYHAWPINYSSNSLSLKIKTWLVRKYEIYRERKDSHLLDVLLTVCESLGEILGPYFHVKHAPVIIRSIPRLESITQKSDYLRTKFNIPASTKILLFSGANIYPKTRNIEPAIDQIGNQPDKCLVILAANNRHRAAVEQYAKDRAYTNIYFHDRVAIKELNAIIASADVGLVPTWNKKDLSYWYALDNKIFDYVMAQIPILATEQPEYKRILEKYKIGVLINPEIANAYFDGFEKVLAGNYTAALQAAVKELNWDVEKLKLKNLMEECESRVRSKV